MPRKDGDFFEILIREHEVALTAFLLAAGLDAATADDVAQDTFIAAWDRIDEYDQNRPFKTWLRGIARHKAVDAVRARRSDQGHAVVLESSKLDAISAEFDRLIPGRGDAASDTLSHLRTCLTTLNPADHDIIQRAYFGRQSCQRIAEALGLTAAAIRQRLHRARGELRDCILGKLRAEAAGV